RLIAALETCERRNQGRPITYFEITTAAAIYLFSQVEADYVLLEVGLGGRLDATNVIDRPALSIITPISIDHQFYLGETLDKIAAEKAGILKRGVPCIIGLQPDEALDVIEARAARLGAPVSVYGQHWHVGEERGRLIFQDETGLLDLPMPNLIGAHQMQNAGIAVAALRALGFGEQVCEAAVTGARWPARLQRLRSGPLADVAKSAEIWLDGGHNPAAGLALAQALTGLPDRPLHLICGMLNSKDVAGFLRPLAAQTKSLHAVEIVGEAASLSARETCVAAKLAGHDATTATDIQNAVQNIASKDPNARILICGSLYLAGQVLAENG
ncbi:MAG: folylpolyglutamate synthase/dihydrofolate synthase family protein, partial [Paracoccaceae bacterium]